MIKKLILFVVISFFVACGSNQNVVRTTRSTSTPSKPIVRTTKKYPVKTSSKSIVKSDKKTSPVSKSIPIKTTPVIDHNEKTSVVKTDSNSQVSTINSEEKPIVNNQVQEDQIEILEATTRVKVTTAMVLDYIEKYKSIAKQDMIEYGIPASIILGQGILESGAGTGPLSAQANNHFGIKCHKEWTGPSVRYNDDEENECFRKYRDPKESYRDHSLFLISRERYSSLFKLDKTDYISWAKGLKNAGYATDTSYPTKLIALIERYNLQQFDSEVLGKDYIAIKYQESTKTIDSTKVKATDFSSNQLHQVTKGDTLYSISKKYNIAIQELKKKNNISNDTLSVGQNLIIN